METKSVNIHAHNYPEVLDILNKKFLLANVLNKERKFVRFEGKNFVYKYRIKICIRKQKLKCSKCGYEIEGKPAWHSQKQVCQYCYKTLTKGYHK